MAVLVLGSRISDKLYGRAELELAGTLSFAAAIALKNSELVEQLHSAATTDELTGLYNRRALEERLAAEISRSLRHQLHTSVLLIDLDRFKVINDTMGHAAGDRLLIQVAKVLRQQCRALDVVGRLGGDEFLVILPMTKPSEAQVFVGPGPGEPSQDGGDQPRVRRLHAQHGRGRVAPPRHHREQPAGRGRHGAVQGQAGRAQHRRGRGRLADLMALEEFILLGDALWLDFVNSARGRIASPPDLLPDSTALRPLVRRCSTSTRRRPAAVPRRCSSFATGSPSWPRRCTTAGQPPGAA